MYADRDFAVIPLPEPGEAGVLPDLIQDLELKTLWEGMAGDDDFLLRVAQSATLSSLTSVEQIRFRQQVLDDCLHQPAVVREMYNLAVEAIAAEKQIYRSLFSEHGEPLLRRSISAIDMFVGMLRRLRHLAAEHADEFHSAGFRRFFGQVQAELDEDYLAEIKAHVKALRFREGLVLSAQLGAGNQGTGYLLRTPGPENRGSWYSQSILKKPFYSFTIPDRDEAGFRALSELRDRGLDPVADAVSQSSAHVLSFFLALRTELGFYVGALNLHEKLTDGTAPVCYPDPSPVGQATLTSRDLYDPCLSLRMGRRAHGNDLDAEGKNLIIVTGANQGGKSTFLRSMGLAHLMMQAGLFVTAASFASTVTLGVYTHYKREEDATMSSGKFDEELARMSHIAEQLKPRCLLMCNESFAATNEREGSDIAAGVIRAMNDAGIRVVFVTHMYDLARRYEDENAPTTLFLRADRGEEGHRTFELHEAAPLPTSFGADLYQRTFYPQQDHERDVDRDRHQDPDHGDPHPRG